MNNSVEGRSGIKRRQLLKAFLFCLPLTAILSQDVVLAATRRLRKSSATNVKNRYWLTFAAGKNTLSLYRVTAPKQKGMIYLNGRHEVLIKANGRWESLGSLPFSRGDAQIDISSFQAANLKACKVKVS